MSAQIVEDAARGWTVGARNGAVRRWFLMHGHGRLHRHSTGGACRRVLRGCAGEVGALLTWGGEVTESGRARITVGIGFGACVTA